MRLARMAGLCYLVVIAGGLFSAVFVREQLYVEGDAAATMRNITASPSLWRSSVAVHALYFFPAAAAGVILYRLFKPVHETLALLALVLALAPIGIEAVLLQRLLVPLEMDAAAIGVVNEGVRHALGYLAVRSFLAGWMFSLLLFSGFCTAIGILILRSALVPRVIGVLMIGAGFGYFVNSLAGILSPGLARALQPTILVLPFAGELFLALWLAIKGVRVRDDGIR